MNAGRTDGQSIAFVTRQSDSATQEDTPLALTRPTKSRQKPSNSTPISTRLPASSVSPPYPLSFHQHDPLAQIKFLTSPLRVARLRCGVVKSMNKYVRVGNVEIILACKK